MAKFFSHIDHNGDEIYKTVTRKKLVKWVMNTTQGHNAFDSCAGAPGRTIETYLDEYSYRRGIVSDIAKDMDYPGDDWDK